MASVYGPKQYILLTPFPDEETEAHRVSYETKSPALHPFPPIPGGPRVRLQFFLFPALAPAPEVTSSPQTLGPPPQSRDWELKPKPPLLFLWNCCLGGAPRAPPDAWRSGCHSGPDRNCRLWSEECAAVAGLYPATAQVVNHCQRPRLPGCGTLGSDFTSLGLCLQKRQLMKIPHKMGVRIKS